MKASRRRKKNPQRIEKKKRTRWTYFYDDISIRCTLLQFKKFQMKKLSYLLFNLYIEYSSSIALVKWIFFYFTMWKICNGTRIKSEFNKLRMKLKPLEKSFQFWKTFVLRTLNVKIVSFKRDCMKTTSFNNFYGMSNILSY